MTTRTTTLAIAVAMGTAAAACAPQVRPAAAAPAPTASAAKPVGGTEQPAGLASLTGRQWMLREWRAGEPFEGKPVVTLAYADGRFTGKSGCNRYTTTATAGPTAPTIVLGPIAGTRMACPQAVMAVEARFLAALGHVQRWALAPSGDLALSYASEQGGAGTLLFSEVTTRRSD